VIVFRTVDEAKDALKMDKLGAVYYKASVVFVATSAGTGTFSVKDWESRGGPSSQVKA
jgi:hypothetical protein